MKIIEAVRLAAVICFAVFLTGCASRPSAAVLQPMAVSAPVQKVSILTVTNRQPTSDGGFAAIRGENLIYEIYGVSVPPGRRLSEIKFAGQGANPKTDFLVVERKVLTEEQFVREATRGGGELFSAGLFVHGYNQSFQEGLFRSAQVAADANTNAPVIMFSWPSEASLLGYLADRDESLASRSALVSTMRLLTAEPNIKTLAVMGHSMGAFLVMEALRELGLSGRRETISKLAVVLAAPDIDLTVFETQIEAAGRFKLPMTILVSPSDRALAASSMLGSDRPRVGMLHVTDPFAVRIAEKYGVAIVDISSVPPVDPYGHDGFASLAGLGRGLAIVDATRGTSFSEAGLFIFDATHMVLTSPFRLTN